MTYRTLNLVLLGHLSLRDFLPALKRRRHGGTNPEVLSDHLLRDIGVSRFDLRFASRHLRAEDQSGGPVNLR